MMKVSLFKEYYQSPQIISLFTLMEDMQSEKYAKKIRTFRRELTMCRPDDRCAEDKKPPCIN